MKDLRINKKYPIFITLLTIVTVSLYSFMTFLSGSLHVSDSLLEKFGAPYAIQIYQRQYWGVIVNSLIHSFPLHLVVNLAGLWVFGAFLERRIGWWRILIFGLVSSIFASLNQLALTNDAGLGLSVVNYAMFGLIFVLALRNPTYKMKLHIPIALFMVFFIGFSAYMNFSANWSIGIEAQLSGLFWGILIGFCSRIKSHLLKFAASFIPFLISLSTLFYAPWSSMWQCSEGINYHEKKDYEHALEHYTIALEIEPNNYIAKKNIQLIQIDELSKEAYLAHTEGRYVDAHRSYLKILAIDKNNAWARTNMKALP